MNWAAAIRDYVEGALEPQLRTLELDSRQLRMVVADIRNRLESIARHWNDPAFRRTILTIGYEEAAFYKPRDVDLDIRAMVVVAVRNSLIEDLAASRAATKELGLTEPVLTDSEISRFTSAAIKRFRNSVARAIEAKTEQVDPKSDLLGSLPNAHPHAWHVLSQLANSPNLECSFNASPAAAPASPWDHTTERPTGPLVSVVASGIDPSFDRDLVAILNFIKDGEVPYFFADSFKGITRNPVKLFQIFDFVLGHGAGIVTHNYLLTPTYASRREPPLRPFHLASEMQSKFLDRSGLSQRHEEVLNEIEESIASE